MNRQFLKANGGVGAVVFFIIFILLVFFGPLIGIWVINTLFDLHNPYDFTHWFAVLISGFAFGSSGTSVRSK